MCRDGKEFAKNWSTLRVKTRAEWDGQISKFDISSTDIYRDILHTQNEISSQSVFKIFTTKRAIKSKQSAGKNLVRRLKGPARLTEASQL